MRRSTLGALAAGAAAMYLLDPDHGRRRRALLRDRAVTLSRRTGEALEKTARDAGNRARGLAAEARGLMRREPVDDAVLVERVRAQVGWAVTHPGAIEASAQGGTVTLRGPVLAHEVDRLLRAVRAVRGVRGVEPRLEIHDRPGDVPGLQGEARPRAGGRFELLQRRWSPSARVLTGTGGAALAAAGMMRGGALGAAAGLAGLALAARAATNLEMPRLLGVGAARGAVTVQKAITIDAPVEEVYAFWTDYESFPRFMSGVREVRRTGPDRTHWTVAGLVGADPKRRLDEDLMRMKSMLETGRVPSNAAAERRDG